MSAGALSAAGRRSLADFLLARIAEDEAAARAALTWQRADPADRWTEADGALYDGQGHNMAGFVGDDVAPHIARWDPARVLAECEAKRRFVRNAQAWDNTSGDNAQQVARELLRMMRLLAVPYADRPGYREEWRL